MAAYLFYAPRFRPLSPTGEIMPGAYIQFYDTGTTTPTDVYSDAALTTPLDNPVIANSEGEFAPIYLNPSTTYRAQLFNDDDELQWDEDPLSPPRDEPVGTVKMFHGTSMERDAAYPTSLWQICDGSNGSPDMRDRMPIGAGVTYSSGETGGTSAATSDAAGGHDHGGAVSSHTLVADEMPEHRHRLLGATGGGITDSFIGDGAGLARGIGATRNNTSGPYVDATSLGDEYVEDTGGGMGHDHDISSVANHQHSITVDPPRCGLWFLYRHS